MNSTLITKKVGRTIIKHIQRNFIHCYSKTLTNITMDPSYDSESEEQNTSSSDEYSEAKVYSLYPNVINYIV